VESNWNQRFLVIYSGVLTTVFAGCVIAACATAGSTHFDEITVQRINVVEPNGTPRLIIANKSKFPGSFFGGQEVPRPDRQQTGFLFMNDEGTEMGGLVFSGVKDTDGQIRHSGHLSFDQYDQDQIFAVDAGQDGARKRSLLAFSDRGDYSLHDAIPEIARIKALPPGEQQAAMRAFFAAHPGDHQRLLIGRAPDQSAILRMMDTEGRDRIVMRVSADGAAVLQFLDDKGKVTDELPRRLSGTR